MDNELIKRILDLKTRCERTASVTTSTFLTPAEQYEMKGYDLKLVGGCEDNERKIAVFIPDWMYDSSFDTSEFISALCIKSYFGVPSHRDYLGAVLGIGLKREWIGDILVFGDTAYLYCLNSVKETIINDLERVGRITVKVSEIQLSDVPKKVINSKKITFTVKSMRLDAITGEMFGISRTSAAQAIKEGLVSHNYNVCEKTDAAVNLNDVISIRGKGKGIISDIGGKSRKDRIFVTAEIFI